MQKRARQEIDLTRLGSRSGSPPRSRLERTLMRAEPSGIPLTSMEVDIAQVDAESGMEWGLLWFDDNRRTTFATKVKTAARQHREKSGRVPDTCYVHPTTLSGEDIMPEGIDVLESTHIQPDHFWIGLKSGSH